MWPSHDTKVCDTRHPNATIASVAPQVLHWLMYIASLMYIMRGATGATLHVHHATSLKGLLERDNKRNKTMDILNDPLPDDIIQGAREAKGNIVTKNASYRRAVCTYLGLR
jgi:hypothetical protein